mgnify:CR=1 FL=1
MNLQELLQLLGAKEVDLYLLKKRLAEVEQELALEHAKQAQVAAQAKNRVEP